MGRDYTMGSEDFNGFANWDTWNVALWVGNDEGLYNMMLQDWPDMADRDADNARTLACALFDTDRTPDNADFSRVHWEEIAESWDDDCGLGEDEDDDGIEDLE